MRACKFSREEAAKPADGSMKQRQINASVFFISRSFPLRGSRTARVVASSKMVSRGTARAFRQATAFQLRDTA
jgi:hypothetical protein